MSGAHHDGGKWGIRGGQPPHPRSFRGGAHHDGGKWGIRGGQPPHPRSFHVAVTLTGTPLKAALPVNSSSNCSSVRSLMLAPAYCCAVTKRIPGLLCPQPCGMLTTPGIISSLISSGSSISPTRERTQTGWFWLSP